MLLAIAVQRGKRSGCYEKESAAIILVGTGQHSSREG